MPRAPQSRALLAGRPAAKRCVFSKSVSRERSIPFKSGRATRLTFGTGCKARRVGMPDERFRLVEVGLARGGRREPLQGPGNPLDKTPNWFLEFMALSFKAFRPVAKPRRAAIVAALSFTNPLKMDGSCERPQGGQL